MTTFQILTLVSTLVGTISVVALGIAKYRHQIKHAPTKLQVIPTFAFPGPMDEMVTDTYFNASVERALERLKTFVCIAVTNLGSKPHTIHEVGFIDANGQCIPWRDPDYVEPAQSFPLVIDPDQTVSVYRRVFPRDFSRIHGVAYAKTDCGEQFTGTSPIITDFLAQKCKEVSTAA